MQLKSFWQRLMIKLTSLIFHQSVPTTVTQCTLPDAKDIIDKTILRTRKIHKKKEELRNWKRIKIGREEP